MPAVSAQLNDFIMPRASRPAASQSNSKPWFSRMFAALADARTRQAEREVARLLELQGGRLTDTIERQIEARFI